MTERYWQTPEAQKVQSELPLGLSYEQSQLLTKDRPSALMHAPMNEWFWVDATTDELIINVHQSYFDVANAARTGGELSYSRYRRPNHVSQDQLQLEIHDYSYDSSWFTPRTDLDQEEWASFVMPWSQVYDAELDDENGGEIDERAVTALRELDDIIREVSQYRYPAGVSTPQLFTTMGGTVTLGGQLAGAAKSYFAEQAQAENYRGEPDKIVKHIGHILFVDVPMGCEAGPMHDGRFISNTGVCMGTGSLEVMPDQVPERKEEERYGYRYSSHNLDSALTQLWAFAGLARLIGDAHRHYATAEQL